MRVQYFFAPKVWSYLMFSFFEIKLELIGNVEVAFYSLKSARGAT